VTRIVPSQVPVKSPAAGVDCASAVEAAPNAVVATSSAHQSRYRFIRFVVSPLFQLERAREGAQDIVREADRGRFRERASHRRRQRAFRSSAAAAISVTLRARKVVRAANWQPATVHSHRLPAVVQTWYAGRELHGPGCDLVNTLMLGRATSHESLVVARATRGWFRGAHSIGMIVKLAAQTTVNAIALIITAFLLRGWISIHPFFFRLRCGLRDNASRTADCSFF